MDRAVLAGIIVAALFATAGVLWLSTSKETLDEVAKQLGIEDVGLWNPFFPDYSVPGHEGNVWATLALSLASTAMVFCAAYLVLKLLVVKRGKR